MRHRFDHRSGVRVLAIAVLLMILVCATVFVVAFVRAPSVAALPSRVAAFERVKGIRPLLLSQIAPTLREAVVATEDERFYDNSGVDVLALARAVPYDLSHWSLAQGASTITEQLAKIIYLNGNDHSPLRKASEIALGFQVGHRFSHEAVLASYLNVVYLGGGRFGVANAADHYFGRAADRLTLAQSSLLAGLIQSPEVYDPLSDPQAARNRQIAVLRAMVRNGYVTEAEAAAVIATPLRLATGTAIPPHEPVSFAVPAPFDWAELALATALLIGAIAAYLTARLLTAALTVHSALRVAAALLVVAAAITAANSVQVL